MKKLFLIIVVLFASLAFAKSNFEKGDETSRANLADSRCTVYFNFKEVYPTGIISYYPTNMVLGDLKKAQKQTPNVCFVALANLDGLAANKSLKVYTFEIDKGSAALAYGTQAVAYRHVDPVSGTITNTSNGNVTTFNGTVTTTGTEQVPYTISRETVVMSLFTPDKVLLYRGTVNVNAQTGGDASSSLGYNVTSMLMQKHEYHSNLNHILKIMRVN